MFPGVGRQAILIFTFTIFSSFGKRKAGFVEMKPFKKQRFLLDVQILS